MVCVHHGRYAFAVLNFFFIFRSLYCTFSTRFYIYGQMIMLTFFSFRSVLALVRSPARSLAPEINKRNCNPDMRPIKPNSAIRKKGKYVLDFQAALRFFIFSLRTEPNILLLANFGILPVCTVGYYEIAAMQSIS